MVEYFTQEHGTELSEQKVGMVDIDDEIFEQNLRSNLQELTKDPRPRTIENILIYSRSLKK